MTGRAGYLDVFVFEGKLGLAVVVGEFFPGVVLVTIEAFLTKPAVMRVGPLMALYALLRGVAIFDLGFMA